MEACVAERLTLRTPGFKPRPSRCFLRQLNITIHLVSLQLQVYKWITATYSWGVTLRWTSIPSRGEKQRARSIQPKFQPVRPGKVVHLKRWTRFFETFPVGPNRSIEFWTEIFGNFGWMDRAQRGDEWSIRIFNCSQNLPLLDLLAKFKRVLASSCSPNFCSYSQARFLVSIAWNFVNPSLG